jgi:myo-inositol-1(or 4)-monophosphatase
MRFGTLPSPVVEATNSGGPGDVDVAGVMALFGEICDATAAAIAANSDWAESGRRAGQYRVDLALDDLCVSPLLAAGFDVLSEESGHQRPPHGPASTGVVVVDPLDGSTNAGLGIPWFATALCLVVAGAPVVAMVSNLATGERFEASAGRGATSGGRPLAVAAPVPLGDAIVAVSGLPSHHAGWRQFRAFGAAALDICAVARGAFDGFVDMSVDAHGVWDYLAAVLIATEAGAVAVDVDGRDLVAVSHTARRTPIVASHSYLLDGLAAHRRSG